MPSKNLRNHGTLAVGAALVAALFAGCAGSGGLGWDGVLQIEVEPVALPESGRPVRIAPVRDAREFRAVSYHPWEPTVFGGGPLDLAGTERVVGRRFSDRTGNRGGNLTLPEGLPASELLRDALVRAFRSAGYRAEGSDLQSASEPAVDARLLELWVRAEPSARGTLRYEARTRAQISGDVPGVSPSTIVCGRGVLASGGRSRRDWERVLGLAVSALVADVEARLRQPSVPSPEWRCLPSAPEPAPPEVLRSTDSRPPSPRSPAE